MKYPLVDRVLANDDNDDFIKNMKIEPRYMPDFDKACQIMDGLTDEELETTIAPVAALKAAGLHEAAGVVEKMNPEDWEMFVMNELGFDPEEYES